MLVSACFHKSRTQHAHFNAHTSKTQGIIWSKPERSWIILIHVNTQIILWLDEAAKRKTWQSNPYEGQRERDCRPLNPLHVKDWWRPPATISGEKIKVSQASLILTSKDRVTAHVALMELKQEECQQRAAFKPMQLARDETLVQVEKPCQGNANSTFYLIILLSLESTI